MLLVLLLVLLSDFAAAVYPSCPQGGSIYARGMKANAMHEVVNIHNKLRKDIANAKVKNQPRGINLKKMRYDYELGRKARAVSNTCVFAHVMTKDPRFWYIGQNIYIDRSSKFDRTQQWTKVVEGWFNEEKDFTYPSKSKPGKKTGHYTQVVWANSTAVGCDYIYYYDRSKPKTPYSKLYTCNYGPGGNVGGQSPYDTGKSGCENLC